MQDTLEVRSTTENGASVFVTRAVRANERLGRLAGPALPVRTRYSIERDGQHFDTEAPLRFVNHSCEPNAGWTGHDLIARRDLQAGDEVTFDYEETESAIAAPFHCRCLSKNCRAVIGSHRA